MSRMVRIVIALGVVGIVTTLSVEPAWAGERVDVAVFELHGEGIDDDLLDTLSGVLRREAQQHDRYSLANPAAIRRSEIALVVGCNPEQTECLRAMADYVDGQVLIFGEVIDRGDELVIAVDILDVASGEDPVTVRRRIADVNDPVVAFRREVEKIFSDLDSIGETHLIVEAPGDDIPIKLENVVVGRGHVERRGMSPGSYHIVVGHSGAELWDDNVELEPGQLVEVRPESVEEVDDPEVASETPEMGIEETTVVPGEGSATAPIEYEGRRSNLGAFSLMGTGLASLAGSGAMGILMRRTENQIADEAAEGTLDEARHEHLTNRGESYQTAHYVLLGVGATALAIGGGWATWNFARDRSDRKGFDDGLSIRPTLRGLAISGRW